MDFASLFPIWLDNFLIAPFRWFTNIKFSFWIGSSLLVVYAILIGEFTANILFLANKKHYFATQDEMVKNHNLSVEALQSQDKETYQAINKVANEHFGKNFFAQAAVGMTSLWPVPFALGWLALRFEEVPIHHLPFTTDHNLGYVFVFMSLYIPLRIGFGLIKKYLPFFSKIEFIKREARENRGQLHSFFRPINKDK